MHDLDSALEVIRARDDTAAKHAHALWQVMRATAAHPTKVTKYEVQQMVWGTLPLAARRPDGAEAFDDLHDTCEAFAELLDLLGHRDYACLCRDETTHAILDAARDDDRYRGLVERAWRSSGVYPPDPPTLTWSDHAGDVEQALRAAAGRMLEEAIDAGTLRADATDDPERVELVLRLLMSPDTSGEDTWFGKLLDERLDSWILGRGSQTRREVLVRLRPEVRRPPEAAGYDLPALETLLDACRGKGARLTERGYLPTALVAELAAVMPTCRETPASGRGESAWPPIRLLRELATDFGLVERAGPRLLLTDRGDTVVDDPDALLMAVGETIVATDRPAMAVIQEVALGALLLEDRMAPDRIFAKIAHVFAEDSWTDPAGLPLGEAHAREAGSRFLRTLRTLDALDADWNARRVGLTDAGTSIARWALRTQVLFPAPTLP
ncbi:hypothetical protein SAMN05192558_113193 [Actinokineospora alba]|uniref:Uncharacterized protein n=1 Tax=Actinokineospora alba TaxID=504798 RepID=A0A1H0VCS3_9PSEU|nr:hypothetical protein [Actinokineospora alba]TDP65639.1 hypothetical protein C8E96_1126 [Actinokineospora alba]SDH67256.1 hypothetical protein SAMN05421871_101947 [Actinokineospora alba]SDP76230.1 hypothetical protein SAMN05192558_113193 [Actinokineospora alba]